jgi:hypothetical protein
VPAATVKVKPLGWIRAALCRRYSSQPFLVITRQWSPPRCLGMASHCVLLDPFKDACAIDHGAVRAGYAQNLVMVAVEVAGMEQSGFLLSRVPEVSSRPLIRST